MEQYIEFFNKHLGQEMTQHLLAFNDGYMLCALYARLARMFRDIDGYMLTPNDQFAPSPAEYIKQHNTPSTAVFEIYCAITAQKFQRDMWNK